MPFVALLVLGLASAPSAEGLIYRADKLGLWRMNLDGTDEQRIGGLGGDIDIVGIAVFGQHIYWADYGYQRIGRVNVDGTDLRPSFIHLGAPPSSVAVDGAHIYFTINDLASPPSAPDVGRADIGGGGVNEAFITLPTGMSAASLSVTSQGIFWGYQNNEFDGYIARANLDGSAVNPTLININHDSVPYVVANEAHIYYWSLAPWPITNPINRANLDGSGVAPFVPVVANVPNTLAIDANYLYWGGYPQSRGASPIERATLADGTVQPTIYAGSGSERIVDLAVDGLVLPPVKKCSGKKATVIGTNGKDKLKGTKKRDVIAALAGKDVVKGRAGNDLICGGKGRDTLLGGKGNDTLLGQASKDVLKGGPGKKDKVKGGPGKDSETP